MISKYYLFLIFISTIVTAQKKEVQYWINENGKSITSDVFVSKWRYDKSDYARWDYRAQDSIRVARLTQQKFATYQIDYKLFLSYFQELSNKVYPENSIFLIEYHFLNDYCDGEPTNVWEYDKVDRRSNYTDKQKSEINKVDQNIVYLVILEEGIKFRMKKNSKEYYFTDKNNFLRKSIFVNPSLCGSFLITKPDGKTLVRNGEFNATMMIEYLKPNYWDSIFK